MKKIVSFCLAVMLLCTTALAGPADDILAAYQKAQTLLSANLTLDISAKLNQPLRFLDTLPEDEYSDVDYALLLEGLADAGMHIEGAYLRSPDRKKADMAMTYAFDVPLALSEELKLDAWAQFGSWIQYDFSDPVSPFYRVITKTPMEKNYFVTDVTDGLADTALLYDTEAQEKLLADSLAILKETAEFTKAGGIYTVTFTDESLRSYLRQLIPLWQSGMELRDAATDAFFGKLNTWLESCTLLGSDGMTIQLDISPEGWITVEDSSMHLAINLYDLLTVWESSTNGLDREDAWIDVTFTMKSAMSDHNAVTAVDIPEVNEDNAYFPNRPSSSYYPLRDMPVFAEDAVYYPAEKILSHYGFQTERGGDTLAVLSPDEAIMIAMLPDDSTFFINGIQITLDALPAIMQDGKLYFSHDLFALLGIDISASATTNDLASLRIHAYYYNPSDYTYEAPVPEEGPEEIPRTFYYGFSMNRMPPVVDNQCYMPIYEFLLELSEGEFSYGDGSLTFVATGEKNWANITQVSAWVGDPYIFWNGEAMPLSGSVVEQEGVMYIPASFAEQLGMTVNAGINFYSELPYTHYDFHKKNPDFQETYIPRYLSVSLFSDQVLYAENELLYMPAYDFFLSMFEGEFTFDGGMMTYTATGENDFGVQSISVRAGDDFITIDGKAHTMEASAVDINGVIRIPVSAAALFGLELNYVQISSGGSSFEFSRPNPEYTEDEDWLWYEFF